MRTFLFTLFLFSFFQFNFSQTRDLENMAEGEMVYADILYDAETKLYGYIYFFDQGDIDSQNRQFEYILLDRNLNKVANGTFTERNVEKAQVIFDGCTLIGDDEILFSKVIRIKYISMLTFNRIISLKEKTVSEPFYFEHENFKDLDLYSGAVIHEKFKEKEAYTTAVPINYQKTQGFFIVENYKQKQNFNEKSLKLYDSDRQPIWSYDYNPNGTKKSWKEFSLLTINDGLMLGGLSDKTNTKYTDAYKIVGIDVETGKQLFDYPFENENSEFSHTLFIRNYGDRIFIMGNYSPYSKNDFNWEKNLGIYRIELDKTGKEISKKYYPWNEFTGDLETNKYGKADKGFYLTPLRYFIFKDGSFSHLTEKFKDASTMGYGTVKSTDFVLFNFDKEGKLIGKNLIEKDQTKAVKNDYLFHQYIKDNSGIVFFFRDYKKDDETRDKNWILGINTIIDGKFNEEVIPISSEDYFIQPIPAKEGYILLREFNKKSEFDQLRLERLNY